MTEYFAQPDDFGELHTSDLETSLGERLGAQIKETLDPQSGVSATQILRKAGLGLASGVSPTPDFGDIEAARQWQRQAEEAAAQIPETPIEDARARVKREGLDLKLPDQPTIKSPVLELMLNEAREHRDRQVAIARGPQGFVPDALGFLTSVGAGMIDPVNAAAFSIPVMGEARWGMILKGAGSSIAARAGLNAVKGAAQGAVGATALAPAEWWLHTHDGHDYTFADALNSVVLSAGMGGAFHAGLGAIGDIRARARGLPLVGSPEEQALQTLAALRPARTLADLPPAAQEDVVRASVADVINDQPVRASEMLETAGAADPRIAESLREEAYPQILRDVHEQLTAAGMDEEEAAANAAVVAARYVARADRLGLGPDAALELYRNEGLEVRAGEGVDVAGRVLAQPGRRGLPGQMDMPGFGPISDAELAQRRANEALKPKAEQKPMDFGLFGDEKGQIDLVDLARSKNRKDKTFEQAARTAPTFYSAVGRMVGAVKQEKAPADQWLGLIKNLPGVKPEEVEWLGLERWLKGHEGPVSKAEVLDYIRANQIEVREVELGRDRAPPAFLQLNDRLIRKYGSLEEAFKSWTPEEEAEFDSVHAATVEQTEDYEPRYPSYRLPGGENYRELLLALPLDTTRETAIKAASDRLDQIQDEFDALYGQPDSADLAKRRESLANERVALTSDLYRLHNAESPNYTSPHWGEPNVLAHVRFDDRDDGKTLHIAEVQSDWHQAGRKHGYVSSDFARTAKAEYDAASDGLIEHLRAAMRHPSGAVNEPLVEDLRYSIERDIFTKTDSIFGAGRGEAAIADQAALDRMLARYDERDRPFIRRLAIAENDLTRSRRHNVVPDAPFKTTWPELALKRMIRYAAENGYERLTWDIGATAAERFDLSRHVEKIIVTPRTDARTGERSHSILVQLPDGHAMSIGVGKDGVVDNVGASNQDMKGKRLDEVLGKDLADKILATEGKAEFSGLDLKLGGEGMAGFYDKILPAAANKLVKKYGAKVGRHELPAGEQTTVYEGPDPTLEQLAAVREAIEARPTDQRFVSPITGERVDYQINRASNEMAFRAVTRRMQADHMPFWRAMAIDGDDNLAEIFGGKMARERENVKVPVHSLTITPELRQAAVESGFPLFQEGEGGPRGRITLNDNKAVVELFAGADRSTFMHEAGHLWLEELVRDAARPDAPAALKADHDTVMRWLGVKRPEDIDTEHHEKWARGFEQYLAEGRAPSKGLQGAFDKFKDWLLAIYRSLSALGQPINGEIRGVMDRLLATDKEIADKRAAEREEMAARLSGTAGPKERSLFAFLAARGGLRADPELDAIFGGKNPFVPGFGRLIRKNGGLSLDRAREAAEEGKYLFDVGSMEGGTAESGMINRLLEALGEEFNGKRQYRAGEEKVEGETEEVGERLHHIESALDDAFERDGLPAPTGRLRDRVIEILDKEGVTDPLVAYERAAMEDHYEGRGEGEEAPGIPALPGWNVPNDAGRAPPGGGAAAGLAGPEGGRAGLGARPAGGRDTAPAGRAGTLDRATVERAFSRFSDPVPRDDERDIVAASQAADKAPDPESTEPEKALSAAETAAKEAEELFAALEPTLSEEERQQFHDALQALDQDNAARAQIIKDGAACLAEAAGGSAVAPIAAAPVRSLYNHARFNGP